MHGSASLRPRRDTHKTPRPHHRNGVDIRLTPGLWICQQTDSLAGVFSPNPWEIHKEVHPEKQEGIP
jgi:hypothetical protein